MVKKLNNKGLSVIELVVVFAILMIIVIGMLEIIISLKSTSVDKETSKNLIEFSSTLQKNIYDDLIKKGYQSMSNCTNTGVTTTGAQFIECKKLNFKDGSSSELLIDLKTKAIFYNNIKHLMPDHEMFEFRDRRIFYNDSNHDMDIYIEEDTQNLKINIPYFIVEDDVNHGFKIIHPINITDFSGFVPEVTDPGGNNPGGGTDPGGNPEPPAPTSFTIYGGGSSVSGVGTLSYSFITGDWAGAALTISGGVITQSSLTRAGSSGGSRGDYGSTKIDLTNYKTLTIKVSAVTGTPVSHKVGFLNSTANAGTGNNKSQYTNWAAVYTYTGTGTYTLNVSSLSGTYYFAIETQTDTRPTVTSHSISSLILSP